MKDIFEIQQYKGFTRIESNVNWAEVFEVFENKKPELH